MRLLFYFFFLIFNFINAVLPAQAQTFWDELRSEIQLGIEKSSGGVSGWETADFGQVRLVSCRTGIKDLAALLTGVEVTLDPKWVLKEVNIYPVQSDSYKATALPVFNTDNDVHQNWKTGYTGDAFFPIWLEPVQQEDLSLRVAVDLKACLNTNGSCKYFSEILDLPLTVSESYGTSICAALNHSLITAAVDMDKTKVQSSHQLLDNGNLKIQLVFPKKIQNLDIQEENDKSLIPIFSKIDDQVVTLILRRETPIQVGEKFSFNIRSSAGCYILNIVSANQEIPDLPDKLSLWTGFWSGLLFFLLSPIWCWWMMPQKITQSPTELKKKFRLLQLSICIGIILLGGIWIYGININNWLKNWSISGCLFIALTYLLIKPIQPLKVFVLLMILLPKPFLNDLFFISDRSKIGLLIWWFVCSAVPLNVWLLCPQIILKFFKKVQKENVLAYLFMVRLPYAALLIWLGLTVTGYFSFQSDRIFNPDDVRTPAIVRVTNPTCLSCFKHRALLFSSIDQDVVPIYRINSDHAWVKQKKKEYGIKQSTFNLLITPDGKEIVLPQKLTLYKLKTILDHQLNP